MRGAAERGHAEDRLLAVGTLPGGGLLHRIDALVVEVLADGEAHAGGALVDGVERPRRPPVLVELQHMQDIGDGEVGLARRHDLARLHAAAALDQLELVAFVLEVALLLGDELDLVGRHRDGIDAGAGLCLGPRTGGREGGGRGRDNDHLATLDQESHVVLRFVLITSPDRATASPGVPWPDGRRSRLRATASAPPRSIP